MERPDPLSSPQGPQEDTLVQRKQFLEICSSGPGGAESKSCSTVSSKMCRFWKRGSGVH